MIAEQQQAWRGKREEEEEIRSRAAVHHHDPGPLANRRNIQQHRDRIELSTVVDCKTANTRLKRRGAVGQQFWSCQTWGCLVELTGALKGCLL